MMFTKSRKLKCVGTTSKKSRMYVLCKIGVQYEVSRQCTYLHITHYTSVISAAYLTGVSLTLDLTLVFVFPSRFVSFLRNRIKFHSMQPREIDIPRVCVNPLEICHVRLFALLSHVMDIKLVNVECGKCPNLIICPYSCYYTHIFTLPVILHLHSSIPAPHIDI